MLAFLKYLEGWHIEEGKERVHVLFTYLSPPLRKKMHFIHHCIPRNCLGDKNVIGTQ